MEHSGRELLIIAFEMKACPGGSSSLNGPDFGHFCADSTAAKSCPTSGRDFVFGGHWVDKSGEKILSNEWRFVQRVSNVVFGWVDKLSRFL